MATDGDGASPVALLLGNLPELSIARERVADMLVGLADARSRVEELLATIGPRATSAREELGRILRCVCVRALERDCDRDWDWIE